MPESLSSKVAGLRTNKRLRHKCFPVKLAKFLRTPILKNICQRLLLSHLSKLFFIEKVLTIFFVETRIRLYDNQKSKSLATPSPDLSSSDQVVHRVYCFFTVILKVVHCLQETVLPIPCQGCL